MTYPVVRVRWLDAEGCGHQEAIEDVSKSAAGVEVASVGYLLADNDTGVVVVQSLIAGGESVDHRLSIPRAYVREVVPLGVRRAPRVKAVAV